MQQLKTQPSRIFGKISNEQEKDKSKNDDNLDNELFGMWKDRDDISDVNQYVRKIRKARFTRSQTAKKSMV